MVHDVVVLHELHLAAKASSLSGGGLQVVLGRASTRLGRRWIPTRSRMPPLTALYAAPLSSSLTAALQRLPSSWPKLPTGVGDAST